MNSSNLSFPERVETVILGATWYGCGLASALKSDVLVLDRTIVPGWEFALAMDPGSNWDAPLANPEVAALREDLIRRNALTDGVIQHAALGPQLARWCMDKNIPVGFTCDVVNVSSNCVEFQAVDGLHKVACSKVISAEPVPRNGKKYLSIILYRGKEPFAPLADVEAAGFKVFPQCVAERLLWQLELDANAGWIDARKLVLDRWNKRPLFMRKWQIVHTAIEFSYGNDPNAFAALERGILEANR